MTTKIKDDLIKFADSLHLAKHDCPFQNDFDTTVLRHSDSKKWFALIFQCKGFKVGDERELVDIINLKCDPDLMPLLFSKYRSIVPAYHMSKSKWISIVLDGDVDLKTIKDLILLSYDLTQKND